MFLINKSILFSEKNYMNIGHYMWSMRNPYFCIILRFPIEILHLVVLNLIILEQDNTINC